jgi:nitronate monooxygenase
VLTDAISGRPARARRSAYAEAMRRFAGEMAPFRAMYGVSGPLEEASGPDGAATFHLYGQAAALARAEPAGDLVRRLAREVLR